MRQSIFIGYRRRDTGDVAGRLYDALSLAFGEGKVFKDVDSIPVGADFTAHIKSLLPRCRVFLALIGPNWVDALGPSGGPRFDDPADLVRVEIETALKTPRLLVVPVLVNGARMPTEEEVPECLRPLLQRHAAIIRSDPDFKNDVARLVQALRDHLRTGRLNLQSLGGAARVAANAAGLSGWAVLAWLAIASIGVTAAVPQLRHAVSNVAMSVVQPNRQSATAAETPDALTNSAPLANARPDITVDSASENVSAEPPPASLASAPQDLGNGISVVLVGLAEAPGRFNPSYVATLEFENTNGADAGLAAEFFYHNSGYHGQIVLTDGAGGSCVSDDDAGTLPTVGSNDNNFRTVPAQGRTRQTIVFQSEYCDSPIRLDAPLSISGTLIIRENDARRSAAIFFSDVRFVQR